MDQRPQPVPIRAAGELVDLGEIIVDVRLEQVAPCGVDESLAIAPK